jgi:hypothetical protein
MSNINVCLVAKYNINVMLPRAIDVLSAKPRPSFLAKRLGTRLSQGHGPGSDSRGNKGQGNPARQVVIARVAPDDDDRSSLVMNAAPGEQH